jgi:hypothetical protein
MGWRGEKRGPVVVRRVRHYLRRTAVGLAVAGATLVGPAQAAQAQVTHAQVVVAQVAQVAQVTLAPDSGAGPGGAQLQQLVNWGAGMALIGCVAAMVFHALRWGWGSQQHNMARVQDGKEGVGRAALVAGVIAAAAALVNFAAGLGGQVQ